MDVYPDEIDQIATGAGPGNLVIHFTSNVRRDDVLAALRAGRSVRFAPPLTSDGREQSGEERELDLYIQNEVWLHEEEHRVEARLVRQWVAGTYAIHVGIAGYRRLIDAGAKQYHREHGTMTDRWSDIFSTSDRNRLAERYALHLAALIHQPQVWGDLGDAARVLLERNAATV